MGLSPSTKGFNSTTSFNPLRPPHSSLPWHWGGKGYPACEQRGLRPTRAQQTIGLLCPLLGASRPHPPELQAHLGALQDSAPAWEGVWDLRTFPTGSRPQEDPRPCPGPASRTCTAWRAPAVEASCRKAASLVKLAAPLRRRVLGGLCLSFPP